MAKIEEAIENDNDLKRLKKDSKETKEYLKKKEKEEKEKKEREKKEKERLEKERKEKEKLNKKTNSKQQQKNDEKNSLKNKIRCKVVLLDESVKTFDIDKSATGQHLFDLVCQDLELIEKDYFSLTFKDQLEMKLWIDYDKKIKSQLKDALVTTEPTFNFEVKFYPPEPNLLQEEITRYLLTLQLRHDIMYGKLPCSFVTHALLGSYTVQAELGDYEPERFDQNYDYLHGFCFSPTETPQLFEAIANFHKDHKGQTPAEAEMHFLENAVKLAMYGVDLHKAKDSDGIDILLGISSAGLMVYRDSLRINRFSWPKIIKISYKRNYFYLKLRAGEFERYESTVGFRCPNHKAAKRLWKMAVEHHAFFRLREPEKPKKSLLPTFNQRFRYTGSSTYMQTRQRFVEREQPSFTRSLSKRLTQSMDRGLAISTPGSFVPPHLSTLSIPGKKHLQESEFEDENEYQTDERRLPRMRSNIETETDSKRIPNIKDGSIGVFGDNQGRKSNTMHNLISTSNNQQDEFEPNPIRGSNIVDTNRNDDEVFIGGAASSTPILKPKIERYVPPIHSAVTSTLVFGDKTNEKNIPPLHGNTSPISQSRTDSQSIKNQTNLNPKAQILKAKEERERQRISSINDNNLPNVQINQSPYDRSPSLSNRDVQDGVKYGSGSRSPGNTSTNSKGGVPIPTERGSSRNFGFSQSPNARPIEVEREGYDSNDGTKSPRRSQKHDDSFELKIHREDNSGDNMRRQKSNENPQQISTGNEKPSTSKKSSGANTPTRNVTYVERTLVVDPQESHQEILLKAIKMATELDPDLEVEKVEITTED